MPATLPRRSRRTAIAALLLACAGANARTAARRPKAAAGPSYAGHPAASAFAIEVAARRGLSRRWLARQLAHARRVEAVRRLVIPATGAAQDWAAYRARFVEPQRIDAGVAFWRANAAWLERAEQRFGVAPEIVVAILGVETYYGRVTGAFRQLDALATLAFDFPPGRGDRSAYFRAELEEFLVLCEREGVDPQTPRGSYAGAAGLAQFMPSSVNRWALDFDGDGHVALRSSAADAIGSVAHYLADFGWQRGMPTHYEVTAPADPDDRAVLLGPDIVPSATAAQFAERGAALSAAGREHAGLLALIELSNGNRPPSYVAGTQNFYVITRYNRSSSYAMAVAELAAAVRKQHGG